MVEILLNCPQVDLTVGKKYHMFSSSNEDEGTANAVILEIVSSQVY